MKRILLKLIVQPKIFLYDMHFCLYLLIVT